MTTVNTYFIVNITIFLNAAFFYYQSEDSSVWLIVLSCFFAFTNLSFLISLKDHVKDINDKRIIVNTTSQSEANREQKIVSFPSEPDKIVKLVNEAIEEKKKMKIVYLSASGEKTKRTIEPKYMDEFDNVQSFCHLRNEMRSFKISRMKDAAIYA